MHLLARHTIARTGDGPAPELLRLLSVHEAQTADKRLVPLRRFNPAIPEIAGTFPDRREPQDILRRSTGSRSNHPRRRPPG